MTYYVKKNNRIIGPFKAERILTMLEKGKLTEANHLSTDKEEWYRIDEMKKELEGGGADENEQTTQRMVDDDERSSMLNRPQIVNPKRKPREKFNVRTDVPRSNQMVGMPQFASPPRKADKYADLEQADKRTACISVLWNPMEALPAIYEERDGFEVMVAGMMLVLLSALFIFIAGVDWRLLFDGRLQNLLELFSDVTGMIAIPVMMMFVVNVIVRILCTTRKQGGLGGDFLIAGATVLPLSVGVCLIALLGRYVNLQSFAINEVGAWLLAIMFGGILLYCAICFVFIILAGITRIDEIGERVSVLVATWTILMGGLFSLGAYRLITALKTFNLVEALLS